MSWFSLFLLVCLGSIPITAHPNEAASSRQALGWQDTLDEIRDHESSADRLRTKLKKQMQRRNRRIEEEFALHLKKQRDHLQKMQGLRRKRILNTMKHKFSRIAEMEEEKHKRELRLRRQRAKVARDRHRLEMYENSISPSARTEFRRLKDELRRTKEDNRKEMQRFMKRARAKFQLHMRGRAIKMKEILRRLEKCEKRGDLEKVARLLLDADKKTAGGRRSGGAASWRRRPGRGRRGGIGGDGDYHRSSRSSNLLDEPQTDDLQSDRSGRNRDFSKFHHFDDDDSTTGRFRKSRTPGGKSGMYFGSKQPFHHSDDLTDDNSPHRASSLLHHDDDNIDTDSGSGSSSRDHRSLNFRSSFSPSLSNHRSRGRHDRSSRRRHSGWNSVPSDNVLPPDDDMNDASFGSHGRHGRRSSSSASSMHGGLDYSPKRFNFHEEGDVSDPDAAAGGPPVSKQSDDAASDDDDEDGDTESSPWAGCDDKETATYSTRKNGGPCDHAPVDMTSSYGKRLKGEDMVEAETATAPTSSKPQKSENKLFKFLTNGRYN